MTFSLSPASLLTSLLALLSTYPATTQATLNKKIFPRCRCLPGDDCWPAPQQWASFNSSIGGKLIATVPLAQPCHNPNYDTGICENLQQQWLMPQIHYTSSSSIMAPFFANKSCDPFDGANAPCIIGTYVQYAVNVQTAKDVSTTLLFANRNNIRVVIRNTGHDYLGKSTGAGSIGLWTHNLKAINFTDYKSKAYTGKAIKVGAGVQAFEAYQAAHDQGLVVVGGECPTVGGGHSALASKFGLAADQTLEFEVVDGKGNYMVATRDSNSDMFWALSGGGGGTYGVVISMTAKAHPDMPTSGFNLTFTNENITQDTYYEAVGFYHTLLPTIVDAGVMSVWYFTNSSFALSPLTGPGVDSTQMSALLAPFLSKLQGLGINYMSGVYQFPTYLDAYNSMFGPIPVGIAQYGGRLVPRTVVQNNNDNLTQAYRDINNLGGQFIGVGLNVSQAIAGDVYNSVLPAWRTTLIDTVLTTPWNFTAPWAEMVANQQLMTNVLLPKIQALTPDSGSYLNEADFNDPNWKQNFYGPNYDRLLKIKNKYDPYHLFYATTAVGSDYWTPDPDGRLCKTS